MCSHTNTKLVHTEFSGRHLPLNMQHLHGSLKYSYFGINCEIHEKLNLNSILNGITNRQS